ncbi:polysaccharide biosynthesis/export family protein [Daejeonia sp. YH14]|uniref:polysaccharide biosynthesis/export family protein n=1 Tax=Daejeonia sp. YH14 TaxID=3439042 RepID=UPI003F4906EB
MTYRYFSFLAMLIFLVSCKTREKEKASELNYMQNIEQIAIDASVNHYKNNTIQPGDQLAIYIMAKDPRVVAPFNQNYASSDVIQGNANGGSNTPSLGQGSITGPMYLVDPDGNISLPYLGVISTTGKNITELRNEIKEKVSRYVIDPSVSIQLANFRVTVLGEVNRQGDYLLPNGKGTIMNALGLAGDLTMYGTRNNVLIVRNENGNITKGYVNLTDANLINSPFYNLKQNDVIIVSANDTKEKTSRLDPNMPMYLGVAGIVVTILTLIFR